MSRPPGSAVLAAPRGSQGIGSGLVAPWAVCWRGLGAPSSSASTFRLARGVQISQGPKQKGSSLQNVSREYLIPDTSKKGGQPASYGAQQGRAWKNHLLEGSLLGHTQALPGLPWLQPAGSPGPSTSEISMKDLAYDRLKPSPVLHGDEQMLGISST